MLSSLLLSLGLSFHQLKNGHNTYLSPSFLLENFLQDRGFPTLVTQSCQNLNPTLIPPPWLARQGMGRPPLSQLWALLAMPCTWKACQTCSPASWPHAPSAPLSCLPWGWVAFPLPFQSLGLCCFMKERCGECISDSRTGGLRGLGEVPIFLPGPGMARNSLSWVQGRQGNCRRTPSRSSR